MEMVRFIHEDDYKNPRPVFAVWETTLACDLKCNHCGSRAQKRRPDELSTNECFGVIDQLKALGCREITFIGGEAYLRSDWTQLIAHAAKQEIRTAVQTGGRNLTEDRIKAAAQAGLQAFGFSIDGLESTHDDIRGVAGSYKKALEAMKTAANLGISVAVNTVIGPQAMDELPALMEALIAAGVKDWRLSLTVAMGRAADNDHLLLQPYQLLELMPQIFRLFKEGQRRGLAVIPGNNLGYFGPYESEFRGTGREFTHHTGCQAGLNTIGLEADGTIKGCPSLPTSDYAGGNIRDIPLSKAWHESDALAFNRGRTGDDLWGFCGSCYYKDVCRAGCTWTSHTLLGKPGNNPYCHYRAVELQKQGIRERIVKVKEADGQPFDFGGFQIVEEPLNAPLPVQKDARGHPLLRVVA